jgi:hypothetical protein
MCVCARKRGRKYAHKKNLTSKPKVENNLLLLSIELNHPPLPLLDVSNSVKLLLVDCHEHALSKTTYSDGKL